MVVVFVTVALFMVAVLAVAHSCGSLISSDYSLHFNIAIDHSNINHL